MYRRCAWLLFRLRINGWVPALVLATAGTIDLIYVIAKYAVQDRLRRLRQ